MQSGATDSTRAPGSAAVSILGLRFVDDGFGRLVLSDNPTEVAIPLVDDGAGRLVLDDTQTSGLTIRASPLRIMHRD